MHVIVPFAAPLSDAGREAARSLQLPHLQRLLARWQAAAADEGDEFSLSTPHERALARAWGWPLADGALPLAAQLAAADGLAVDAQAGQAWALMTPVHQHVGTEQVSLLDPAVLRLDEPASRELLDIVRPWFESEGFAVHWGAPLRWYLVHESLADITAASLDRVVGRNIDAWLPGQRQARLLRRLQNEVQMLLHTHPVNAGREAAGLPAVNAFWLSGCGRARSLPPPPWPALDERLRGPALNEDWPAWQAAWAALDAGPIAQLLQQAAPGAQLTLAGERRAQTFSAATPGLLQRLASALPGRRGPAVADTLLAL
jgi:hypothetical protein